MPLMVNQGIGGYDIYKSKLDITGKAEPSKNIGSPINSEFDDFAFAIDEKNEWDSFLQTEMVTKEVLDDDLPI